MLIVKKYANRRLYDTAASRYITLEDLAALIKAGSDVLVQDAHSGADLTQATLTQIILESRGAARLLPVPLLMRLIRMGDEALAEFFGRYVSWALELYLQARQGARTLLPLNPLATAPFAATDAFARMVLGASSFGRSSGAAPGAPSPKAPPPDASPFPPEPAGWGEVEAEAMGAGPAVAPRGGQGVIDEMARLRTEIEALKRSVGAGSAPRTSRGAKRVAKKSAKKKR